MNPFVSIHLQERLLLASASPRRREILKRLGFEFEVLPTNVNEDDVPWDDPVRATKLLAEFKAVEAQRFRPRKTIIAADTAVVCRGRRLGKPADAAEAAEMLAFLSGKDHEVITGIALVAPPNLRFIEAERTRVYFRGLDNSEIGRYVETDEPYDKAGAYAIQGLASAFVERIEGCYFNVVGLPVPLLFSLLKRLELEIET
ncbi:MAG: septum formation protein Maf [bacterium]|nr:MAG: septum formation protein Maf [bacterium]